MEPVCRKCHRPLTTQEAACYGGRRCERCWVNYAAQYYKGPRPIAGSNTAFRLSLAKKRNKR